VEPRAPPRPSVSSSLFSLLPLTIRRHRKEPPPRREGGRGAKFWGKQIEIAVSPCRRGRPQRLGTAHELHGRSMPAFQGGLRRDPIQPPFRHPGRRQLSCQRCEKPFGMPQSVPPSFGLGENEAAVSESAGIMVPTLGSEHRLLKSPRSRAVNEGVHGPKCGSTRALGSGRPRRRRLC
jgi:hypothetical protein